MSNLYNNVAPVSSGVAGAANSGVDFTAQHTGQCIGIWWFQPASGGPASVTVGLYNTETQALITSAVSGALVPNAWNLVAITPQALTPGKIYTAVVFQSSGNIGFTSNVGLSYVFNGDLTGPRTGGRFVNAGAPAFPVTNVQDRYGVDLEFTQTAPCPTCPDCSFCPCSQPATGPDAVAGILTMIVDCAYAAVDHDGDLAINRRGVVPGEIAWDNCQCGQLALSEVRRYPSRDFPVDEIDHTAECGAPWLVTVYQLSLARCVPLPDAAGNPPSMADLQASAAQLNEDASKIRHAVECCLNVQYDGHALAAYELGPTEFNGPAGQCIETVLTIMLGTPNGCGC